MARKTEMTLTLTLDAAQADALSEYLDNAVENSEYSDEDDEDGQVAFWKTIRDRFDAAVEEARSR